ncbi:hypothetical protein GOP47_0010479 [Adiantum capillus-veneris]|uniref:Uncharacterized protein n=1 Tax=Adiantum capillus-veneris TaxID=13818 RepID=A0A9D4UUZ1_ADICA|nr:hypothetical protein GOP47_0010479 [Adiantum capillus-veneris]
MADKEHVKYEELKYLGFVEATGLLAKVCVVRVYEVGKDWSGPTWRQRIDDIECKIKDALAPLYNLIKGNEHHILLFFDQKLDVCICTVRKHAPHVFKSLLDKTVDVAKKVPDFLVDVSAEVHRVGVIDTAKSYFNKVEPVAEEYIHLVWKQFLKLPYSLTIVHVATPPALYAGDKVNKVLCCLKERHVPLVGYVPLLPLKRIETIIKKEA